MSSPQRLAEEARQLELVVSQRPATERDLALARELCQQYADYMDGLDVHVPPQEVIVKVDGATVVFKNSDDMAAWLAEKL